MKIRIALYILAAALIVLFVKLERAPAAKRGLGNNIRLKNADRWLALRAKSGRCHRLNLNLPCDLTMDGWRTVGSIKSLQSFRLAPVESGGYSSIPHAAGLRELGNLPELREIDLWFIRMGETEMNAIGALNDLWRLRIQYPGEMTSAGVAQIGRMHGLDRLLLRGVLLDNAGLKGIADLPSCDEIRLEQCRLTDDLLASLSGLRWVESLGFCRNRIRGHGLRHLGSLAALEHLDLTSNPIDDDGLAAMPAFSSLKELSLRGTRVSNAGLSRLADFSRLRSLDLTGTRVTDEGLLDLAKCRGLQTLALPSGVGGSGLQHLANLPRLSTLRLSGGIDPDAVDDLRAAMPELEIKLRD
jgi:hypothetical protein